MLGFDFARLVSQSMASGTSRVCRFVGKYLYREKQRRMFGDDFESTDYAGYSCDYLRLRSSYLAAVVRLWVLVGDST
jgi:hypothetical protein